MNYLLEMNNKIVPAVFILNLDVGPILNKREGTI